MRSIHKNVPERFAPAAWTVTEEKWTREDNKNNETVFTVANGYLGIRGFAEEGFAEDNVYADRTTMINGVYEYFPYRHIWCRPGFPERYHAIVAQADPFDIRVYADGETVTHTSGKAEKYRRTLDLRDGTVTREFVYVTEKGKHVRIEFRRFASQAEVHLAADSVRICADEDIRLKIVTRLRAPDGCGASKEEIGGSKGEVFTYLGADRAGEVSRVRYRTRIAPFEIVAAARNAYSLPVSISKGSEPQGLRDQATLALRAGQTLALTRVATYATDRDYPDDHIARMTALCEEATAQGFDALKAASAAVLADFWAKTDIEIERDDAIQQGLRFSAFQIYQSTGKDGITNISANGLSGTGYSGHTFWDTEIFMMPMYIYTDPAVAKQLIMYRYHILDKARERAKQMDDRGALYAWNSINGEECGHVFEAVTAQYHIDNDVFYAIYRYWEATRDKEFLLAYCAEILFEISRCMAHRGSFIPAKGDKFCINVVCGPDEYNPVVDNNMYTNLLTQKQLYFTLEVADMLREADPEAYEALAKKCGVTEEEKALWKRAADRMYIPYSDELGMYMQDDNFIYKDPIDVDTIPRERLPLLTHLHPLNLWRYQVCKQADIVLLTFLCSEYFTLEERKKIFAYYEPKTIHDSSLSASIHSIVACDVGDGSDAYGYLRQAARMDLDNVNGNTFFGLHAACMGATWMMMVNGYAGLRIYDDVLHFKPFIDEKWRKFAFSVLFRGTRLRVTVTAENTTYETIEGGAIEIEHHGHRHTVDGKLSVATRAQE